MKSYTKDKLRLEANSKLLDEWIKKLHKGKSLSNVLRSKNYTKVAIYGMNYIGERVLEELENGKIEVVYGIDKEAGSIKSNIKVVTLGEHLQPVDAVLVTPIYYYEDIKRDLEDKIKCPIVSLENIIYEM